ncbi:hypothetical protein CEP53_003783 [Fusarium sp. AF-6]|nr:hypothetical protein CEP53_003783 [Fusarium sp. AF-6]
MMKVQATLGFRHSGIIFLNQPGIGVPVINVQAQIANLEQAFDEIRRGPMDKWLGSPHIWEDPFYNDYEQANENTIALGERLSEGVAMSHGVDAEVVGLVKGTFEEFVAGIEAWTLFKGRQEASLRVRIAEGIWLLHSHHRIDCSSLTTHLNTLRVKDDLPSAISRISHNKDRGAGRATMYGTPPIHQTPHHAARLAHVYEASTFQLRDSCESNIALPFPFPKLLANPSVRLSVLLQLLDVITTATRILIKPVIEDAERTKKEAELVKAEYRRRLDRLNPEPFTF